MSLNDDVRTAFAESGTMHLLAISGLHVGILAGFVWFYCRLFNLSPTATSVIILVTVVGYALVTDARPSIVRATVFLFIAFAGRPWHRYASLENTVAIAAILILMWNPTNLFDTGCQLSFLAIMAMIWLQSKPFRMRSARSIAEITSETHPSHWVVNRLRPLWTGLKRGYLLTFAIWLFTVPLVAARFNLVSPIGLVINVFLIPLVIVVLWMGYGLLFCGFVLPEAAPLFGLGLDSGLRFLMFLTESAANFRMGHFYVPGPTQLWLTGYYAILAGSLCLRSLPRARIWSWMGLCGWVVLGLGSSLIPEKPPGLRCTFLSVGHGCSVLIEFPNGKTVLYDAGSIQDGNRAQRAVQSTLWDRGISRLNAVIISHADIDHFNGLPGLFRTVGTDSLLVAKPFLDFEQETVVDLCRSASANHVPTRLLARGDRLKVDDSTSVRVLHPAKDAAWTHDNESSVVLLIEFGGRKILLTGDLEGEGLAELLAGAAQDVDVMLAPHHGSRRANLPELARWAQPEWVVVSGGRRGTVARLQSTYGRDTRILSTIENGAITFQIDPQGIVTVTTSRASPSVRTLSHRD